LVDSIGDENFCPGGFLVVAIAHELDSLSQLSLRYEKDYRIIDFVFQGNLPEIKRHAVNRFLNFNLFDDVLSQQQFDFAEGGEKKTGG
jgi:hypothetical protein